MNTPTIKQPQRPTHISAHAEVCLRALSAERLGDRLSVGQPYLGQQLAYIRDDPNLAYV